MASIYFVCSFSLKWRTGAPRRSVNCQTFLYHHSYTIHICLCTSLRGHNLIMCQNRNRKQRCSFRSERRGAIPTRLPSSSAISNTWQKRKLNYKAENKRIDEFEQGSNFSEHFPPSLSGCYFTRLGWWGGLKNQSVNLWAFSWVKPLWPSLNITLLPWRWAAGSTVWALDTDERDGDEERAKAKETQFLTHQVRQTVGG